MNQTPLSELIDSSRACIPAHGRVPTVIYAAGGGAEAAAVLQRTIGCTNVLMDAGSPYSREAVTQVVGQRMQTRMENGVRVGGATSFAASHLLASAAWVRASSCATLEEQARGLPVGAAVTCTLSGVTSTRDHGDEAYVVVRFGPSGHNTIEAHILWQHGQKVCDRAQQSEIAGLAVLRALLGARERVEGIIDSGLWSAWGIESISWRGHYKRVVSLPPEGQDAYLPAFGTEWIPLPKLDPTTHYLFSGSFRPLHYGHLHNRTQVDLHTGRRGILQLSRNHPKKGPIEPERIQEVAAATYGVCDLLVGEDDGRYADKVARWGLDVALGTDVYPHISRTDCAQIAGMGRNLLLIDRLCDDTEMPRKLKGIADAASFGFPLVYCSPYKVSSTILRP